MIDEDNKNDEIIDVRLPRADYDRLRTILERERSYNWLGTKLKSHLIWILGSGILTFFLLFKELSKGIGVK